MSRFSKEKEKLLRSSLARFDEMPANGTQILEEAKNNPDRTFLYHILIETLCTILEENEARREKLFEKICRTLLRDMHLESAISLEALAVVRRDFARQFYQHIKEVRRTLPTSSGQELSVLVSESIYPKCPKYDEVFDQIDVIAAGGFGTVCKARHRIDGIIYAVKKIIFRYQKDSDYDKVMREVKSIANLSHSNVVRYYSAWVQTVDCKDLAENNFGSSEINSDSDSSGEGTKPRVLSGTSPRSHTKEFSFPDSESIIFEEKEISKCQINECCRIRESGFSSSAFGSAYSEDSFIEFRSGGHSETEREDSNEPPEFPSLVVKMMLCIQMEFCDCDLRHWLNLRNEGQPLPFLKKEVDIFKEILSGVVYIHSKSVIHRDLKPQNIFFSTKDQVLKIGDFGLATLGDSATVTRPGHSTNLGTLPYAAPEQREECDYDSKVDIYSLGVILLELLNHVGTSMELCKVIDGAKRNSFPAKLVQNYPGYDSLVHNLLQNNPDSRMTAKELLTLPLLQMDRVEDLKDRIKELEEELARKDELCRQLQQTILRYEK